MCIDLLRMELLYVLLVCLLLFVASILRMSDECDCFPFYCFWRENVGGD